MSLLRCRTCRTLGDTTMGPYCMGCGEELKGGLADPTFRELPEVELEAGRDIKRAGPFLILLYCFGGFGIFTFGISALSNRNVVGLAVCLALTVAVGLALAFKNDRRTEIAGKVVLGLLAGIGALFMAGIGLTVGLLVLLFVVCSTGGFR